MSDLVRKTSIAVPRWRRWFGRAVALLAFIVIVGSVRYWLWHWEIGAKLADALAEMDARDPGWRLQNIEAAREVIPEDENAAHAVFEAGCYLPFQKALAPPEVSRLRWDEPNRRLSADETDRLKSVIQEYTRSV